MITPADSPSSPSDYNAVPVTGLDIQAPQDDLGAAVAGAVSTAMARQPETSALLNSAAGMGDFDVTSGYTGTWGSVPEPATEGP